MELLGLTHQKRVSELWLYSCITPQGVGRSLNRKGKAIHLRRVPGKGPKTIVESPYRKPTQVLGHKCAKADERNIVQELGKKVAVTSG